MDLREVMDQLEEMGTAQNRKIYERHGAKQPMFGVSFANLNILKKKIGTDHELAMKLWETGNTDAMTLSTMIADPALLDEKTLDSMANDLSYYMLTDLLADLVSRSEHAREIMSVWMGSDREFVKLAGYSILSSYLKNGGSIPDQEMRGFLDSIEREIHTSPNRARLAMNNAVIAIGTYGDDLVEAAFETAERIGKVNVDHGQTSCKTPEIIPYIKKARARREKKKSRR
ncbi:MAG: DNA alkylation repair protein [Thermoplasmatota archaeon]